MARWAQRRRMSDRASLLLTIAISPVVLVAIGFAVFSLLSVFSLIFAAAFCETTDESVILAIMAIVYSIAAVLTLIATSYACQSIHRGLRRWWYLDAGGDSVFCLSCDYNLARNTSGTCPECGTPIPQFNDEEPDSPSRSKAPGRWYGRQRPSVERREVNGEHGTATVARVGLVSRRNGADRLRRSWTPAVLPTLLRTVDRSSLAFGLNASRTSTREGFTPGTSDTHPMHTRTVETCRFAGISLAWARPNGDRSWQSPHCAKSTEGRSGWWLNSVIKFGRRWRW